MAAGSSGLNSLLVATDLTAVSDRVFDRVPRLPLAANAKVTVLHVIPESLPRRERVNHADTSEFFASPRMHPWHDTLSVARGLPQATAAVSDS